MIVLIVPAVALFQLVSVEPDINVDALVYVYMFVPARSNVAKEYPVPFACMIDVVDNALLPNS